MAETFERQTILFVLRLWLEPGDAAAGQHWRGQLEHVGSGASAYFQVPVALVDAVAALLPGAAIVAPLRDDDQADQAR